MTFTGLTRSIVLLALLALINITSVFAEVNSSSSQLQKALALQKKGADLLNQKQYKQALQVFKESTPVLERLLGKKHVATATSYYLQSSCLSIVGPISEWLDTTLKAFYIYESVDHTNDPDNYRFQALESITAILGQHYRAANSNMEKAEFFFRRNLLYNKKIHGEKSLESANSLHFLSTILIAKGSLSEALSMNEKALDLRTQLLGANAPKVAASYSNIGAVFQAKGQPSEAFNYYVKANEILKKSKQAINKEEVALNYNSIAQILSSIGDYNRALSFYLKSMEIRQELAKEKLEGVFNGIQQIPLSNSLNDVGCAYADIENHLEAINYFNKAINLKNDIFGKDNVSTSSPLLNMACSLQKIKLYDESIKINLKAIEINKKHEKNNNFESAQSLAIIFNNLGTIFSAKRDFIQADFYFKEAFELNKKTFGLRHNKTLLNISNLAFLNYEYDKHADALEYAQVAVSSQNDTKPYVLSMDEKSRLAWQKTDYSYSYAVILPPDQIADLIQGNKGVVFDSLLEDRAVALASGQRSDGAATLQKIADLRARLSKILFEPGNENEVSDLESEISLLQTKLAANHLGRETKRRSLNIRMSDIALSLSRDSVIIDFFHFHDPKIKDQESECIGVIITGQDNKPALVRIDQPSAIHRSIEDLRKAINQGDAVGVEQAIAFLSAKLWLPIAAKIPQHANCLIISPDGELNFLPFAALLDAQGKFLAETYDTAYIGSARDLVRETKSEPSRTISLFANPAFQRAPSDVKSTQLAMRSAEIDLFGQIQLPSLPGTEKERAEIQKIATDAGWNLKTFTQNQADEQTLRKTKKPGILHLATHGFYLNSFIPAPLDSRGLSVIGIDKPKPNSKGVDPMRASGIALAGAQSTLKSWSERKAPAPETDGVLTAEEVAALDLDGTWLVTLSACETGVGEARSGEGVFGLRRSFMMAGAENLLMTLWPVRDQSTSEIMADFYREALKTGNAPSSLAKVQREWLVKLRKEKSLLEAVRDAGPFVMATIGKPLPPLRRNAEESQASLKQLN
jgi:CHAT domain-containing protein/tetratricopeptide (TPR) repeat protein